MKRWEKAWLAAIIDGEGCLSLGKRGNRKGQRKDGGFCPSDHLPAYEPLLNIVNTDKRLIDRVCELVGERGYLRSRSRKGALGSKPCWDVFFRSKNLISVLKEIEPYLISKKEIAKRILEWDKFRQSRYHFSPSEKRNRRQEYDDMATYVRVANAKGI